METIIGKDVHLAASLLNEGKLVAIPTETVYGLAGNALDENAVLNIFKTKQRPEFDPLIVHVGTVSDVQKFTSEIPGAAFKLMQECWPGPLTLLLKKKPIVPDLVTSGLDTVGVRMPRHPLTLELLRSIKFPLAAPSANPFGYISPTTASHVHNQLGGSIPYILDGGPCEVGIESTIIGFEDDKCVIFRLGGMSVDAIERIAGKILRIQPGTSEPKAPGMLKSHYAPGKPVFFGELSELVKAHSLDNAAVLCFTGKEIKLPHHVKVYALSQQGSLEEAAHFLFSAMREFDRSDAVILLAQKFPDSGLGKAINDRLMRAATNDQ